MSTDEERLAQYSVVGRIGAGRFGEVFQVRHKKSGNLYCWKLVQYKGLSEKEKEQLVMEVNVMRELKHPNIVRYVDRMINRRRHELYILMEYCDAGDLSENMREFHKLYTAVDEKVILDIALQLLFALAYCHNCQLGTKKTRILHRDLKPQNIFLSTTRHGYTCKIGDFGLCRHIGMDSFAHSCVGTPYYWCPELLLSNFKNYNDKMDMWALGCVLYELSCGKTPFHRATTLAELVNHMKAGVPLPLADRSPQLNCLLNVLLQPNPAKRPSALQCLGYSFWKGPATRLFLETLQPKDKQRMTAILSPSNRLNTPSAIDDSEVADWYNILKRGARYAQVNANGNLAAMDVCEDIEEDEDTSENSSGQVGIHQRQQQQQQQHQHQQHHQQHHHHQHQHQHRRRQHHQDDQGIGQGTGTRKDTSRTRSQVNKCALGDDKGIVNGDANANTNSNAHAHANANATWDPHVGILGHGLYTCNTMILGDGNTCAVVPNECPSNSSGSNSGASIFAGNPTTALAGPSVPGIFTTATTATCRASPSTSSPLGCRTAMSVATTIATPRSASPLSALGMQFNKSGIGYNGMTAHVTSSRVMHTPTNGIPFTTGGTANSATTRAITPDPRSTGINMPVLEQMQPDTIVDSDVNEPISDSDSNYSCNSRSTAKSSKIRRQRAQGTGMMMPSTAACAPTFAAVLAHATMGVNGAHLKKRIKKQVRKNSLVPNAINSVNAAAMASGAATNATASAGGGGGVFTGILAAALGSGAAATAATAATATTTTTATTTAATTATTTTTTTTTTATASATTSPITASRLHGNKRPSVQGDCLAYIEAKRTPTSLRNHIQQIAQQQQQQQNRQLGQQNARLDHLPLASNFGMSSPLQHHQGMLDTRHVASQCSDAGIYDCDTASQGSRTGHSQSQGSGHGIMGPLSHAQAQQSPSMEQQRQSQEDCYTTPIDARQNMSGNYLQDQKQTRKSICSRLQYLLQYNNT